MFTFFSVTGLLFDRIKQAIVALFDASSTVIGAIALIFCVVLVINIFNNKISKKFFVNNKTFIFVTLLLEAASCLISSNEILIKFNFFTVLICLLIILYKTTAVKKQTKRVGTTNEKSI